jgi:hypothetical protein
MFTPETLKVRPGTTIIWSNQDMMPHTVTSIGPATDTGLTFDSGVLNPSSVGKQWGLKLDQNGAFEYVCQLHRGMSGQVVVAGDHPESFSQTAFGLLAAAGVSGTFGALVAIKLRKKRSMP